jgi:hypothetical protein
MTLPNFVGIGAQRAATTWMYSCLKEHPEVFMSDKKELHFFNQNFDKGLPWYEAHFEGSNGQQAIGEITPNYLNSEVAIPRMAKIIPNAYLIVILREPIQRAFSAYKLLYEKHYQGMSFADVCKKSGNIINLGLYASQMERVYEHYKKYQVKVFLYDDIQHDASKMLSELFCFLQIDDKFTPRSMNQIYNSASFPKAQSFFKKAGLNWVIDFVRETPMGKWIKRQSVSKSHTSPEGKEIQLNQSLKELFRDDIMRLQKIVDRDLSHWL